MTKTRHFIKNRNFTTSKQGNPQTVTGRFECLLVLSLYFYDSALSTRRDAVSHIAKKEVGTHSQMPFNWNTNPLMKGDSPGLTTPTRPHLSIFWHWRLFPRHKICKGEKSWHHKSSHHCVMMSDDDDDETWSVLQLDWNFSHPCLGFYECTYCRLAAVELLHLHNCRKQFLFSWFYRFSWS